MDSSSERDMAGRTKEIFKASWKKQNKLHQEYLTSRQRNSQDSVKRIIEATTLDIGVSSRVDNHHDSSFFDEGFFLELDEAEAKRQVALDDGDKVDKSRDKVDKSKDAIFDEQCEFSDVIEEQYFGNVSSITSNDIEKVVIPTDYTGNNRDVEDDFGYIDSQYFTTVSCGPVGGVLGFSVTNSHDITNLEDLNYVDQQLFGIQTDALPDTKHSISKTVTDANSRVVVNSSTISNSQPQQMTVHDASSLFQENHRDRHRHEQQFPFSSTDEVPSSDYVTQQLDQRHNEPHELTDKEIVPNTIKKIQVKKPPEKKSLIEGVSKKDVGVTAESTVPKQSSGKTDRKGHLILEALVPDLSKEPGYHVVDLLVDTKVYEDDKVVCINKPYSLASQDGPGLYHSVSKYLPEIARRLKYNGDLYLCHRLDKGVSGVLLLAKGEEEAASIKKRFEIGNVYKFYTALTHGVPEPHSGIIDIPIGTETKMKHGIYRSVLLPHDTKSTRQGIYSAQTKYEVVKYNRTAALLELEPTTGRKHQLRVHLADGIETPILGDHKYSHRDKFAPQWLSGDIMAKFNLKSHYTGKMPMHLHARRLVLPNYFSNGRELTLTAKLPKFFSRSIKLMKFFR